MREAKLLRTLSTGHDSVWDCLYTGGGAMLPARSDSARNDHMLPRFHLWLLRGV